ncbi:hypothetical protein HYALB_00008528 [Hymenoscyphus albidus]|uniref:Uncharacterized protein n=1 Tax=Hymenoscyphus albidus TaxID=595503 RepID=A0A9N9LQ64_9HELO|nr:hypothetical protein HYALB_00008528 [Hymenoscyphus albidus]
MQLINFPTILLLAASILSTTALPIESEAAALENRGLFGKPPPSNPTMLNGIPMPKEENKFWYWLNGIPLSPRPKEGPPKHPTPKQAPIQKRLTNPFAKKTAPKLKSKWSYIRSGVPLALRPSRKAYAKPAKRALLADALIRLGLKSKPKARPGTPGFINEQAAARAYAAKAAKAAQKPKGLKKIFGRDGEMKSEGLRDAVEDKDEEETVEGEEEVAEGKQSDAPELEWRNSRA